MLIGSEPVFRDQNILAEQIDCGIHIKSEDRFGEGRKHLKLNSDTLSQFGLLI